MALPWLVLVTVFSLVPELPRVPRISEDTTSVAGHFLVYAVLAAVMYRLHMRLQPEESRRPVVTALFAIVTAAIIGLAFEFAQSAFTETRAFEFNDQVLNVTGATVAALSLLFLDLSGFRLRFVMPVVTALGAALVVFSAVSYTVWDPALPYAGDHWHASYRVRVCGEWQDVFPFRPGNIHTHGDGLIHIHPGVGEDEGRTADLGTFFDTAGGELTSTSITMPSGETFSNGDLCPDGSPGSVFVSLWDGFASVAEEIDGEPDEFVPRDRQRIVIEFGSRPDIETP